MSIISKKKKVNLENKLDYKVKVPHIIKYMGSKRELIDFLANSINEIYEGEAICDLFAGTSILSGALGNSVRFFSNDIQSYSAIFANTYLGNYEWENYPNLLEEIIDSAEGHVNNVKQLYPKLDFNYNFQLSLNEFNALEQQQQDLIYHDFKDIEHHLFIKNYSGTYWSFEQCLWIDALRAVAENYANSPVYYLILSSLMFAMAYNAQSTGHYAQYRDANNVTSMNDIIIYRCKEILPYFKNKLLELTEFTGSNKLDHVITTLDYKDCLDIIPERTIVYADPPYTFVHYSRFYHAIETLVKYDYPNVLFKGRYRNDRHQSPFCKKTEVEEAFIQMFKKVFDKKSKLLLSYSNTGMIDLKKLLDLAKNVFKDEYDVGYKKVDYTHSTMGRSKDKSRNVKEYLIIATPV
jgi:adenine-specific DNA-methyltransferase